MTAEVRDFERAASLRDQIAKLRGETVASTQVKKPKGSEGRRANPN